MKSLLNIIHNADCFEVFSRIPNDSVELVCVDPPYGIRYGTWDCFESQEAFLRFSEKWISECVRVLKPTGTMQILTRFLF